MIRITTYTSTQAATIYHVSNETIRNWSEEFSRYLSFMANPGKGRTRSFSEDDMQIFALIAEMKEKGATFEEIRVTLDKGHRGDAPVLQADEVKAIISGDQERRLNLEIEYLKRTLQDALVRAQDPERMTEENIRLNAQLQAAQERIDQLLEDLKSAQGCQQKTSAEAMQRIEELSKQIGNPISKASLRRWREKGRYRSKRAKVSHLDALSVCLVFEFAPN